MKDFSHPGTHQKTPVDINKALHTTITVARNEWKYVAEVVTDFDSDLPPVNCLPGEMNQVFLNIIVNAAQAIKKVLGTSPEQKGTITVTTGHVDDRVEISIADSGCGIPQDVQSKVFEPFFATKDVGEGTGQGLAIAYCVITENHGGSIHFESRPGLGTTFYIVLPVGGCRTAASNRSLSAAPMKTILFVDDEPRVLEALQRMLRGMRAEWRMLFCESGREALAIMQANQVDVLVSDMRMPGMDGITFLKAGEKLYPESVRMIFTGYADAENAAKAINEGHIFQFLTKPCSTETLTQGLERGLEQYRLITAEKVLAGADPQRQHPDAGRAAVNDAS